MQQDGGKEQYVPEEMRQVTAIGLSRNWNSKVLSQGRGQADHLGRQAYTHSVHLPTHKPQQVVWNSWQRERER